MHDLFHGLKNFLAKGVSLFNRHHVQADGLIAQGHLLEDEKEFEKALKCYRLAIKAETGYARAHMNAGNALLGLKRLEEAVACYREAIRLDPTNAYAYFNLGRAMQESDHLEGAVSAYQHALHLLPGLAEAYVAMGAVYEELKEIEQAMAAYRNALSVRPGFAEVHYNLALLYFDRRDMDNAAAELEQALRHRKNYPDALQKLASVYIQIGFAREAVESLEEARRLEPDNYAHHSHYLLDMNYLADYGDEEVFDEHRAYGEKFGLSPHLSLSWDNIPKPNRILRIGYVSGDFRRHPVLRFIELLLEKHRRDQVEVYCYSTLDKPDAVTERLKAFADHWRDTLGHDDDATAQMIRDDRIDVLVDLSGHTGYQRLAVFARKPAPVQATWLGYLGTTGLKAMDYRICDTYTDPAGLTEQYHTEKLARLPECQWCYRTSGTMPDPAPLPMLSSGHVTFGSFNNIAKLNDQVLVLWARLLREIPGARLLIAAMPGSKVAEERIVDVFAHHGVSRKQLDFRARQPMLEYYRTCMEADLALDPFPYNGGTTSIDILRLGVPIITLAGTRSIGRGGVSLLSNLNLQNFIAGNADEYVDIACHWASRPTDLAALRAALPDRVVASPLMDEERFVANMEQLYREMWQTWCSAQKCHG